MGGSTLDGGAAGMTRAIVDVMAERRRQVEVKGWTTEHDDLDEKEGGLAMAGACYALQSAGFKAKRYWPWGPGWIRTMTPRELLVRGAALLIAEIERRDRHTAKVAG